MEVLESLPAAEIIVSKLYAGAIERLPNDRPFGLMRLISDPQKVHEILARPQDFGKDYNLLTELGASRFDADGDEWAARRNLTQPTYRSAAVSAKHSQWATYYERQFDALAVGPAVGLEVALLTAAAEILSAAFGAQVDGRAFAQWLLNSRPVAIYAQRAAMFGVNAQQLSALQKMTAQIRASSRDLLEGYPALRAVLSQMEADMDARTFADGRSFDAGAEFMLAYLAGTETSVSVISWAIFALARFPQAQDDIAQDIKEHGAKSRLLEVFVQEVMRMRPAVPLLSRRPQADGVTLCGEPVDRKVMLAVDIIGLHHSIDHWDRPLQFMPKRPEFLNSSWKKHAFLPFSAGPRVCGGVGLARAEIHAALAGLLRRFKFSVTGEEMPMEYALTLRPRDLSRVVLERRNG